MFEAYSVGIRISLINGVSAGLIAMSREFGRTNLAAKELQASLNSIKKTMLIGGALAGAGLGLFWALSKTIGPAREIAHQLALMNAAGMRGVEIANAQRAAYSALAIAPTSSVAENLAAIRELRMVFGNTNTAIANLPVVQRLQAILAAQHGDDMRAGTEDAYTVAKALELKGAVRTAGQFNIQADMMAKAIEASGGKVTPQDFLSAFKYGRTATAGWSDQFVYTVLPTLIQEMKNRGGSGGAGGPGNALMSAYAAVVSGQIPQKAIPVWQQLGLLDPSKVVRTRTGATKGLQPGAIQGWELFQQNPFAWAQQVLDPALQRKGITSDAQVRQTLGYMFANRTAGFAMVQMAMQAWKFTRDQKLIGQATGLGGYNQLLKNDPMLAQLALQKQWNSLLATLGFTIMPDLIKMMTALIPMIRNFTMWASSHPDGVRNLMRGLVALATLLTASGIITMLVGIGKGFALVGRVLGIGKWVSALPAVGRGFAAIGGAIAGLPLGAMAVAAGIIVGIGGAFVGLKIGLEKFFQWMNGQLHIPLAPWQTPGNNPFTAIPHAAHQLWDNINGGHPSPSGPKPGTRTGRGVVGGSAAGTGSPHVAPASYTNNGQRVGDVYIDGKIAGKVILGGAVRRAGVTQASSAGFDGTNLPTPVGSMLVGV